MTREFTEMIFLGAGDSSKAQVEKLHKRLDDAVGILGGLQQPLMSTDKMDREVEEHEIRVLREELRDAVEDIVTAFGIPESVPTRRCLTIPGDIGDVDLEKFRQEWNEMISKHDGAWKTPIVASDVSNWQPWLVASCGCCVLYDSLTMAKYDTPTRFLVSEHKECVLHTAGDVILRTEGD